MANVETGFSALSAPHSALVDRAISAKRKLIDSLQSGDRQNGDRDEFLRQRLLLEEYQTFLAAADYLVGYDRTPRFDFTKENNNG
jgi:hypothetical protein